MAASVADFACDCRGHGSGCRRPHAARATPRDPVAARADVADGGMREPPGGEDTPMSRSAGAVGMGAACRARATGVARVRVTGRRGWCGRCGRGGWSIPGWRRGASARASGVGFQPVVVAAQRGQVGFVGSACGMGDHVVQIALHRRAGGTRGSGSAGRGRAPSGPARVPAGSRGSAGGRCQVDRVARWHSSAAWLGLIGPCPASSGPAGVISTCTGTGWPRSSPVSRATNMSARAAS